MGLIGNFLSRLSEPFYDVEMGIDTELFIGEVSEVSPGKYVSFRYLSGDGPPTNPKISCVSYWALQYANNNL